MWFIYLFCLILFYSGFYKNVFALPEAQTTESKEGSSGRSVRNSSLTWHVLLATILLGIATVACVLPASVYGTVQWFAKFISFTALSYLPAHQNIAVQYMLYSILSGRWSWIWAFCCWLFCGGFLLLVFLVFVLFCFVFVFCLLPFFYLGLHPWHIEVPRLGV